MDIVLKIVAVLYFSRGIYLFYQVCDGKVQKKYLVCTAIDSLIGYRFFMEKSMLLQVGLLVLAEVLYHFCWKTKNNE